MKDLKTAILKTEDWLQYIYLFLFTGIVLKYYLNTTLLENSYSYDFYRVVKWTLVVFVVVNLILAAIKRQFDSWLEIVFIVALIACAAVVSYTIGEDEVLVEAEKSVFQTDTMFEEDNFTVALCGSNLTDYQKGMILMLGVREVIVA